MGNEVVVAEPRELVHPATGELIPLDDPRACVLAIKELNAMWQKIALAKKMLAEAVAEEAAKQGSKTLHFPGVSATVKRRTTIEWDLDQLGKLQELGLPEERFNALVKTEVTHKVSVREAARIAGANPEYAEVIERARHDFEGDWYVGDIEVTS